MMDGSKITTFSPVWVARNFLGSFIFFSSVFASASQLHPLVMSSASDHWNNTAIHDFRLLNRRYLMQCADPNPYLQISASPSDDLPDDGYVDVTVSGVIVPSHSHWIAMITPSGSRMESCVHAEMFYIQTGDTSFLPLLCHYPVKAEFIKKDRDYIHCRKRECQKRNAHGHCLRRTCSGTLRFHVINIRTDIEFVFLAHGFHAPCILARTGPISFANPAKPSYGHLSSVDSTGTTMQLTWVSGDERPQQVEFDDKVVESVVETFTPDDMCEAIGSPARDFGWHEPGFIHSALMSGLHPSTNVSYKYGSDTVGWSNEITFTTPPAAGSDELRFLAFGDMGKAPFDSSVEHFIQPGSISVVKAMSDEIESGNVDSIFHIGDISYATGFLVEWDYFLHLITPLASRVSYMTAIGNHERDYPGSGSAYSLTDSGGECGVPYETYFQMPTQGRDKPWYSIEQGCVHFTVISTEHDWSQNSEQYQWLQNDMASVDRSRTPWLVFTGHRPMYSTASLSVDRKLADGLEPLLVANKVDIGLYGHVHNYERTCTIWQGTCISKPVRDQNGVDTYDHSTYTAPMHAVIGMAGFQLDSAPLFAPEWSLARISEYGYLRVHATKQEMLSELVSSKTRQVVDKFRITK